MASYPKEVQERIRALEKEIADIKKEASFCSVIDPVKCQEISALTGLYYSDISNRVSYIARSSCVGTFKKMRGRKNANCVRPTKELSKEEAEVVRNCASEIFDILIKYAKISRDLPDRRCSDAEPHT